MKDEFLTKGLQSDRYLKAVRLINQFEDEIEAILLEFDQRMIDAQTELFDVSDGPDVNHNQTPSNGLALHRINHPMNGARAPDGRQRLNVHLYWMPPAEYGRTDVDGALRAFGYKIKGADLDVDDWVVEQTRAHDWSLDTSDNPYDSNTVFYKHVSSLKEIEQITGTLVDHFATFGDAYAADFSPHEE